jgi:hypothetical protein
MAIFNSYVKLPEGTWNLVWDFFWEQIQGSRKASQGSAAMGLSPVLGAMY